ncbi:MAG: hypothetical protein WC797_00275 [Candidatus Paceibacterota bacterium]|jgi:uncharacterized membrane protein
MRTNHLFAILTVIGLFYDSSVATRLPLLLLALFFLGISGNDRKTIADAVFNFAVLAGGFAVTTQGFTAPLIIATVGLLLMTLRIEDFWKDPVATKATTPTSR